MRHLDVLDRHDADLAVLLRHEVCIHAVKAGPPDGENVGVRERGNLKAIGTLCIANQAGIIRTHAVPGKPPETEEKVREGIK